jgi:hypothetical protein
MTTVGLLYGIHGKKPDAVRHVPQVLVAGLGDCLDGPSRGDVSHDWRFLFREIDRGKGSGRGVAGAQTDGDPARNVCCLLGDRTEVTFVRTEMQLP